jgi:hypothetical protein
MFTLLKYAISVVIWAVVGAAFLIAKSPELFAFWALIGAISIVAWVVKFIWKWIVGIFLPTVTARSYFFFIVIVLGLGLAFYQVAIVPLFNSWGATKEELKDKYPIDQFLPESKTVAFRAITIDAPIEQVYPWIKQLATEGVLSFDINILDFIKNQPAKFVLQDIPTVNIGDRYLIGEIVQSKDNNSLTIELNRQRFPWSKFNKIYVGYYLHRDGHDKTRVVMKIKADYSGFLAWFSAKYLIELGDFWVSSYQLTSIKTIAEKEAI